MAEQEKKPAIQGRMLTVSDVARIRGTDRTSAWRWLQRNAKPYLRRRGKQKGSPIVISARVFALLQDPALYERIERRVVDLERRMTEAEMRADSHANSLRRAGLL